MKLFKLLIISTLLLILAAPQAYGQLAVGKKYVVIPKGGTHRDTIETQFQLNNFYVFNCIVQRHNIGGRLREVVISPPQGNPNYVGKARAHAQYVDNLRPYYIEYDILFVESVIETKDDYVTFANEDPLTVFPLSNDVSTTSGLNISGISLVQGGSAILEGDSIVFTPDSDINMAYLVYSTKDDAGSTMNGVVHFLRDETNFSTVDTILYSIRNTQNKKLILPVSGFQLNQGGDLGTLDTLHDRVFNYIPHFPDSGMDTLVFTHTDGYYYTFIINVLATQHNTSSVRDDVVFTPKNTSVTFDVLANDLAQHFNIVSFSPELVRDTLGVFTYSPPNNFSGVKDFIYTVRYSSNWSYTGKIKVFVGNYEPINTIDYQFNTLKNNSLVINYDVPIDGYNFNILNNPLFGTVEIFQNQSTQEDCNEFYSKFSLIYNPDNNYFGQDSFDVEYCVVNNPCVVYKVYIDVHDNSQDTLCPCQGPDCVWVGDFNGDGRVSVRDILALGRYMGLGGAEREDIDLPYRSGQHAADWFYSQNNGVNLKHIDANGDGLITSDDMESIVENYGLHHEFVPRDVLGSKDISFSLHNPQPEYEPGDLLVIDIALGTPQVPAEDISGLVFGLNINPQIFDSSSLEVVFDPNSWFTKGNSNINLYQQPQHGQVEAALSLVSSIVVDELDGFRPNTVSGEGIFGQILFIVVDELDGFKSNLPYHVSRIHAHGIEIEDVDGLRYQLPDSYLDIKINKTITAPLPTEDKLILYPNPAQDRVILHFNGRNTILDYSVFDAMGQVITVRNDVNAQTDVINTSSYAEGIYVVKVTTNQGTISKKIYITNSK